MKYIVALALLLIAVSVAFAFLMSQQFVLLIPCLSFIVMAHVIALTE